MAFSAALIIFLYVRFENSFDTFHYDYYRIFRVAKSFKNEVGELIPDATTQAALAPAMKREFPEVEETVRVLPNFTKGLVTANEKSFYETSFYSADPAFFTMFSFRFLEGQPETALVSGKSMVITESVKRKYFGDQPALGKSIHTDEDYVVSAVIADVPANTHFHFSFVNKLIADSDSEWNGYNWYTYIKIQKETASSELENKIQALIERNQVELKANYFIQPLSDIHLHSNLKSELKPNGSYSFIKILVFVGGFLLLVGLINFVNLSIVQALHRAKEAGISKILGATRQTLLMNFLFESMLMVIISFAVSLGITYWLLPEFNSLFSIELSLSGLLQFKIVLLITGLLLLIAILSGLFPAIYFSRLNPVKILKGVFQQEGHGIRLRKALVLFQFVAAIALLSGITIIYRQMQFLKEHDLGFDKEHLMVLTGERDQNYSMLKEKLLQLPEIKGVTQAGAMPGDVNQFFMAFPKGSDKSTIIDFAFVDYDFVDVMKLKIIKGRDFSRDISSDASSFPLIINETAVRLLGLTENAVGAEIAAQPASENPRYFKIIGVVKDFHFAKLHEPIKPITYSLSTRGDNLVLKLTTKNYSSTVGKIQDIWKENQKDKPFDYYFFDEAFNSKYTMEENFQAFFTGLGVVTMMIACSGLFAIAAFLMLKRKKEVGIRKAMGASVQNVYYLLSKEYVHLIAVALFISIPVAWWLMDTWLTHFAYRIKISPSEFLITAGVTLVFTLITISYHSVKMAILNPRDTLQSE